MPVVFGGRGRIEGTRENLVLRDGHALATEEVTKDVEFGHEGDLVVVYRHSLLGKMPIELSDTAVGLRNVSIAKTNQDLSRRGSPSHVLQVVPF